MIYQRLAVRRKELQFDGRGFDLGGLEERGGSRGFGSAGHLDLGEVDLWETLFAEGSHEGSYINDRGEKLEGGVWR